MGVGGSGRRGSACCGGHSQLEAEFVSLCGCFGSLDLDGINQSLLLFQNDVRLASGHGRFPLLRGNGYGLFRGLALHSELGLCEGTESGTGRMSARGVLTEICWSFVMRAKSS